MLKRLIIVLFLISQASSFGSYYGTMSTVFDKSPNPYGWFYGYNRKVQTNFDPYTGKMVGSLFRQLNTDYGTGSMGGMTGVWDNSFTAYSQTLYDPYMMPIITGQDPYVCEFINGYSFNTFNVYDIAFNDSISHPVFTVCDATFGWVESFWSGPERIQSCDSSSEIPNARQGTGDVVYDPDSEYYYWTQAWRESLTVNQSPVSCVIGRTKTPGEAGSWVWSDYKELRFDTDNIVNKYSDVSLIGPMHFAYAKDIHGNGTGKGIGVAVTQCYPWYLPQLSYTFTANWGGDSLDGSWRSNWNKDALGFHHVDVSDLFDWVGETLTLTDSIGYDLSTNTVFSDSGVVTIDQARIMWDISVVTTEENIVHILCMAFPASSAYPCCIFPWTDSGFRAGYYDIRGEVSDAGVNWQEAVFIANPVGNNQGWNSGCIGMEFTGDINRTLSLSYAGGNDNIFASWLDRPESRYLSFDWVNTPKYYNYIDDGYLIVSLDGGDTWIHQKTVDIETGNPDDPIWQLKYAANVTKTSSIFEEGWTLSNHGTLGIGKIYTYAACQYADIAGMVYYMDYQRFLRLWDVSFITDGIEPEEISPDIDFTLYQNYPNPFNPATEIKFSLSGVSDVKLSIYNSNGQLVKTLLDGKKEAGLHTIKFNGEKLNSGIYFYQLKINNKTETKKMVLLK